MLPSAQHGPPEDERASAPCDTRGDEPEPERAGSEHPDPAAEEPVDEQRGVEWSGLPQAVQDRLVELAAFVLGRLATTDIPRRLRPVARFAPAKRAKAGAGPLATTLAESARFRTAVVEWLREHRPDVLDPNDDDPVAAAAAAVLLGSADASARIRVVARNAEENTLRAERDAALARAARLESELGELRAELTEARNAVDAARQERADEVERLKGRLREQGTRLREAKDAAAEARAEAERHTGARDDEVSELNAQLERERSRVATERGRAERAVAEAETARESAREARAADETRLGLLLDTLGGAMDGLRQELDVGGQGKRPGDTVRGASSTDGLGTGLRDTGALDRVLGLTGAHLIIDGYNVTKTGYGELALSDQRDRLVQQLAALNARTGAEMTVVFDGAGVVSVPSTAPRGVRVLFSEAGVLADDVIRSLVAAEPQGRPLAVATSDREVVDSVRERGAYSVSSAVLLNALGRV